MNRKFAATVAAVVLCAAAGTAAARFEPDPAAAVLEPAKGIAKEGEPDKPGLDSSVSLSPSFPEASDTEPTYWLRGVDGRLGVFLENSDHPEMVLDVYLGSLPLSDQQALQAGICAGSYRQLVSMIEDYIS
jgi:hypothetical protein